MPDRAASAAMGSGRFDCVISGASFAGLALAAGLARNFGPSIRIAVIDKAHPTRRERPDQRAFAIWRGARHILEGLGIWQRIEARAQAINTIEISDSALDDGLRPSRLMYDAAEHGGEPLAHMVLANDLLTALFEAAQSERSIDWIIPAEAQSLTITGPSAALTLDSGDTLNAALVVAADGRQSKLRDYAGIKTTGWAYSQTGIVATVKFSEPHHGTAIQHFLPGGPFAVLPLQNNEACITWSSAANEAQRMTALDDEAFIAEIEKRIGGRFGTITLAGQRQSWPLDVRLARALTAPRFALAGDAAHGVHPIAGQGVNLAFRDCAALIECLADAARLGFDLGHAPALDRYARWRRFDSTMSSALYGGLNRIFSLDNAVLRAGRGAALGFIDRSAAIKSLILEEAHGLTGDVPKLAVGVPV